MKTKKQVMDLAKSMGVEVDELSDSNNYHVTFFSDKEFSASSATCLTVSWFADFNKPDFWNECYEELKGGFV